MAAAEPAAHHANAIRDDCMQCNGCCQWCSICKQHHTPSGAQIADAIAMAVTSWKLCMQTVGATHAGMTYSPCATDARRAGTQLRGMEDGGRRASCNTMRMHEKTIACETTALPMVHCVCKQHRLLAHRCNRNGGCTLEAAHMQTVGATCAGITLAGI